MGRGCRCFTCEVLSRTLNRPTCEGLLCLRTRLLHLTAGILTHGSGVSDCFAIRCGIGLNVPKW
jgi:hypothetical protein